MNYKHRAFVELSRENLERRLLFKDGLKIDSIKFVPECDTFRIFLTERRDNPILPNVGTKSVSVSMLPSQVFLGDDE